MKTGSHRRLFTSQIVIICSFSCILAIATMILIQTPYKNCVKTHKGVNDTAEIQEFPILLRIEKVILDSD